jgi:four helix bundle protein
METSGYKELLVWQKSIDVVDLIYDITEAFPKKETFGLCSQMQRAAVSIASNIAEGSARHSRRDFVRFLRQSRGSLAEVETQAVIAVRRKYMTREAGKHLFSRTTEINRMLGGLIAALQEKQNGSEQTQSPEN